MNKLLLPLLVVASSFTFACGAAESGDESPTDEGALAQGAAAAPSNAHLAGIAKCEKAHAKAADRAVSTSDMIQAEAALAECDKKANDAIVAKIEANLTEAGSGHKGTTKASIAAFRASSETLCSELDKASPNYGGTLSRVEAAACRAGREAFLAALIDDFVALGDEARSIKEDRAHHKSCYRTYDKRLDQAGANNDMVQASFGLADCITKRVGLLAAPVAKVQVTNDTAAGPETTATDRVRATANDLVTKGGDLCAVLNEAGENGIGSLSHIVMGSCKARVAESAFVELRTLLDETS